MYRLLIVDDEALSRYAFNTLITREFKNIEIVGEADNGRTAIEMNRRLRPDIIIMDIKMPGMNGIEASQYMLPETPHVKILILTAYDHFEYARKAINIGINGYLLKPIQNDEVIDKLNKLIRSIEKERSEQSIYQQTESRMDKVKPVIKKELLNAVLSGNADSEDTTGYMDFLHESFEAGYFMIISIEKPASDTLYHHANMKLMKDMIITFLENRLDLEVRFLLGNAIGNNIIAFFPITKKWVQNKIVKDSIQIGSQIKKSIREKTGVAVAISIGSPYEGFLNLKQSYEEASRILKKAVTENTVLHYADEKQDYGAVTSQYPLELEKELLDQIKIGNLKKAQNLLDDLLTYTFSGTFDTAVISEDVVQFIAVLKRTALKMGVKPDILKNVGAFEELKKISEPDELKLWLKNSVVSIIGLIEALKKNRDVNILEQIHHYMHANFNKDISLDSIAEKVDISPQYLSKVFKEGYGMNFIDYIIEMRLNYSKVLLSTTDKSISEISNAIGYSDANYFCRIFKKNIGITPGQYRSNRGRKV